MKSKVDKELSIKKEKAKAKESDSKEKSSKSRKGVVSGPSSPEIKNIKNKKSSARKLDVDKK